MSRRGFEGNFSRRPANNNQMSGPGSLLGAPPSRGGGGRPWTNNDQQQISRNTGGGRSNFSGGGQGQGQEWRSPSPNRRGGEPDRDIWGTPQRFEVGGGGQMYPNPKNQQHQQQPQVVMVQLPPQGNASNSFMLQNQNPFGQQRQAPMQLILPAFDANIGQQIIQAQQQAQSQGNFGGGNMNMNQPMPMMMNQQQRSQQQYNPFEQQMRGDHHHSANINMNNNISRDGRGHGGDNFTRSSSGRIQRTSMGNGNNGGFRSSIGGRRSDSNLNNDIKPSPRTSFPPQILRGGRKRVGRAFVDDVDRKRSRVNEEATTVVSRRPTRYFPGKANAGGNKASPDKKKDFKPKVEANKGKVTPAKTPAAAAVKTKTPEKKKEEKANEVVKTEEASTDEKKEGETTPSGKKEEKKKSKYDEFPISLLVCKICQKSMNDGHSYESHLNGRAHLSLVKILEDRFQKRGELLMLESKLVEEEIAIEQDRARRAGQKSGHAGNKQKNFCKMCDCNYSTNWGAHKVSLNHRILKEFLHPNCRFCGDQFVHRMDWVNHLYSINHFKKVLELKQDGEDMDVHETFNQEELFAITIDLGENEARPMNALTIRSPNYKLTKPLKDDLKQLLKDHADIIIPDEGEVIIPSEYKEDTPVGEVAITEVKGWICKLCRTYIANEKEVATHCKLKRHFGIYTQHMKKLVQARDNKKEAEKKAAAEKEAKELALQKAQEKKEKDAEAKKNSGESTTTTTTVEGEDKKEVKTDGGDSTVDKEVVEGAGTTNKNEGTGEEKKDEEMETSTNDVSIIENGEEVKETEIKKEVPAVVVKTPAAKSPTAKRGGRGRGMPNPRFTGNRGRGGFTPQGVQAKVETNIRGGRGSARTPSGRGARGNWRGNK